MGSLFFPQSQTAHFVPTVIMDVAPPPVAGSGRLFLLPAKGTTMISVATKTLRLALQTSILTGWTTGKLKLFKNNFTPAWDHVLADFTEATFPGYAAIAAAVTPGSGIDAITGNLVVAWNNSTTFVAGTIVTPEIVYGWYITNNAESTVLVASRFDTPVSIAVTGDILTLEQVKAQIPMAIIL